MFQRERAGDVFHAVIRSVSRVRNNRIALSYGKNYSPRIAVRAVIGYNLTFAAACLSVPLTHTHCRAWSIAQGKGEE